MIKMIISSFSVKQMEVLRNSRLSVIWDILISKAIGLLHLRTFNKNCFECERDREFANVTPGEKSCHRPDLAVAYFDVIKVNAH